MRHSYFILIIFFSFFYSIAVLGQTRPLITGNFKELKLGQFIRELETSSGYHFYYDSLQVDSIQVNLTVKDQPLDKVMEKVLANTGFNFSIDQYNNVFLIRDIIIKIDLPAGFFGTKTTVDSIINPVADLESARGGNIISASLENKLYEIGTKNN